MSRPRCETCRRPKATADEIRERPLPARTLDWCWAAVHTDRGCKPPARVLVREWWEVGAWGHVVFSSSDRVEARREFARWRDSGDEPTFTHVRRTRPARAADAGRRV